MWNHDEEQESTQDRKLDKDGVIDGERNHMVIVVEV